ncbi:AMP-binding protein [Streptomyces sp. SID6673]|nr:AMP-binding protein [Streptomyces sp. SID11726]NEB26413.1 AMP-binding protein [Streptomyces sp. SID6673]
MAETMHELITRRAAQHTPAVIHATDDGQFVSLTWAEYVSRSSQHAAAVLEHVDTARPAHVGALLGNSPEMLVALGAAALGGYVLCGINNTRRGAGLITDLRTADVQILLVDDDHARLLDGLDLTGVEMINVDDPHWAEECAAAPASPPSRRVEGGDPFMIIFTSGTSGDPKAVLLTHHMAVFAGDNLVGRFSLGESDVFYLAMPLFHSNGIMAGFAPAVAAGGSMAPARFSASRFLDDIRTYRATYMNYVGKPLAYVLATPARPDDADNPLRVAFGNEASDRDIAEFSLRFDAHVVDGFGSTENAVIITREDGTPPGSIGRGLPGVAIYRSDPITECAPAIFDGAGRLSNPDDAIGELVNTSGAGFFSGYYNNEKANAERMRGGIYWSGDLAYRDVDGWIYLAGRTADWMRVDGENLTAAPIERILSRCPQINRVAVYAVADPTVGDQIMAAVVLQGGSVLTPDEFTRFLSAQDDLSPKAWPRYVRVAAELPTTATNKILKRALISDGTTVGSDVLWARDARGRSYHSASATVRIP